MDKIKTIGQLGRWDYIYKMVNYTHYRGVSYNTKIEVYRVVDKKVLVNKERITGTKHETKIEFTLRPVRIGTSEDKTWGNYKCKGDPKYFEKVLLGSSFSISHPDTPRGREGEYYSSDLNRCISQFKYALKECEESESDLKKTIQWYSENLGGNLDPTDYRNNTLNIGIINKDAYISTSSSARTRSHPVTWNQLKAMYQNGQLKYDLKNMLDWNNCWYNGFVKFRYDCYTGIEIDWGRIQGELDELIKK